MTQRIGVPLSHRKIEGDVVKGFREKLSNLITKNEGIRQFNTYQQQCYNDSVPFDDTHESYLQITDPRNDISQLDKSFITIKFDAKVKLDKQIGMNSAETHPENLFIHFFLGWKHAGEAFKQIEVLNRNVNVGYLQNQCAKETFCYSSYMSEEKLRNEPYSHSRWEDVVKGNPGVCGGYFKVKADGSDHKTDPYTNQPYVTKDGNYKLSQEFHVTDLTAVVPINNILPLQSFQEWPKCFGDITLKFYLNKDSMVWAQVDPFESLKRTWTSKAVYVAPGYYDKDIGDIPNWLMPADPDQIPVYWGLYHTKHFSQVGQKGFLVGDYHDVVYFDNNTNTISVEQLQIKSIKCDCFGFNVTQETNDLLFQMFTPMHPMIIPSQELEVVPFQFAPTDALGGSYIADMSYTLHNVTDFVLVFPATPGRSTVYANPNITNLQLRVNNIPYPHEPFDSTNDSRFLNYMIRASDLDNFFAANKDYVNSMVHHWEEDDLGVPYDITNFIVTIQAERNGKGYFFDGVETGTQNVNINLRFNYRTGVSRFGRSEAPPELWLCRDTYWTVDSQNGLRYWKTGTPQIFASEEEIYATSTFP